MKVTMIITTYNWPEALRLTLKSIINQKFKPFEVIIADDGSDKRTEDMVKKTLTNSSLRWAHIWHKDKGVRQSRIKNLAVRYSSGKYLVFIDQDTVLHPLFLKDHVENSENGILLQGKRVLLSEILTKKLIDKGYIKELSFFSKGIKNRKNVIRSELLSSLFSRIKSFETSLRGCNISLFKEDFLRVDGFDEVYDGSWGREDSDLCFRLFHSGIKVKNLWFCAIQYHLYHEKPRWWDRDRLDNELKRTVEEKRRKAIIGYSKLNDDGVILNASRGF